MGKSGHNGTDNILCISCDMAQKINLSNWIHSSVVRATFADQQVPGSNPGASSVPCMLRVSCVVCVLSCLCVFCLFCVVVCMSWVVSLSLCLSVCVCILCCVCLVLCVSYAVRV
jgi:hypothetical protein